MLQPLVALVFFLSSIGAGELANGDFEQGSRQSYRGWQTIWPQTFQPTPEFEIVEEGAHGGRQCGQIRTRYQGGYTSFTQELRIPKNVRHARLAGWIRVVEAGENVSASFLLSLVGGDGKTFENHFTQRVTEVGEWARVEVIAAVPEVMSTCLIRCGVTGPARVLFDDLELEWITGKSKLTSCRIGVHDTHYGVVARNENPWVQFSVPLPFAGQTPLAIELKSDPPGRLMSAQVVAERENRLLRVHLSPSDSEEAVRVSARTYVLFEDQSLSDGTKIKLGRERSLPEEVRIHLQPAPGVESGDERISEIADKFSRRDLSEVTRDMLAFLKKTLRSPNASGVQNALACLDRGGAVCTGHANLGAALLIAADVPTRILACVLVGMDQQEHYIVETWTPKLGWSRVETTTGAFPLPASKHLILRVIYPDTERNGGFAPVQMDASEGSEVSPGFGALETEFCWQSGHHLESFLVDHLGLERLRAHSTGVFETLDVKLEESGLLRLAPAADTPGLSERAATVLRTLEGHLAD